MVLQDMTIFSNKDRNPLLKMHGQRQKLKHRFEVIHKLGQGTYGKVQLAVDKDSGQEVAIKTIRKSKIETEQDLIRIRREIQIMSSVQHPHIIHIYEVFENKEKIVLVMQYASGGELYDYLNEKKVLSEVDARRLFRQIASAIYYCHKNKICHRDLKLENIFLDEKGNAKIGDFGLSNVYDNRHFLTTFCGSPLYASPEIVQGTPYYGPEVDCWSMGVLLYTLVYGAMPFDGSNFKRLVKQISEGDFYEPKKKSEASGLIKEILTVSPAKRASIVDICSHWWVNQDCEHSLKDVAEDLANLTPVRLDFLLALAPPVTPTDDSPVDANSENIQPNSEPPTCATESMSAKAMNIDGESANSHDTDGMNDYVNHSQSNSDNNNIKRRSLSVPDIAERAMDFFLSAKEEQEKSSPQKRRDDNDSRSVIAPTEGRKKKPRMGVSALVSETCSTDSIQEDDLKNQTQALPEVTLWKLPEPELVEKSKDANNSSQIMMDTSPDKPSVETTAEAADETMPVTASEMKSEEKSEPKKDITIKKEEEKDKDVNEKSASDVIPEKPDQHTKRSSVSPKKSVKSAKPNLVKKVKKKTDDSKSKEETKSTAKNMSSSTAKVNKEEDHESKDADPKPKPKEDRIVKRPKKIKIPSPLQTPADAVFTPERKKLPGKIPDNRKTFEAGKASPKRPVVIPSFSVSSAKKAFETSNKKSSSPPVTDSRRKSSVTSATSIRKSSITPASDDASAVSVKKESNVAPGKDSKSSKSVKPKLSNSRSSVKTRKKSVSKSPSRSEKTVNVKETSSQESVSDVTPVGIQENVANTKPMLDAEKTDTETDTSNKDVVGDTVEVDLQINESVKPVDKETAETSPAPSIENKSEQTEESEDVSSVAESQESGDQDPELFIREENDMPEVAKRTTAESIRDSEDVSATDSDSTTPHDREDSSTSIDNDLKTSAKDILKRNIAKAKLTERRLSKQNSLPEEPHLPSTPPSGFFTPPVVKSAFRIPKPYVKEEDEQKVSTAEIVLKKQASEPQHNETNASVDSERPDKERPKLKAQIINSSVSNGRRDSAPATPNDLTGGHAITKSFRKFTFTKDGKCIEETGRMFQNDPDGKWTTIKTTTVKTNSNGALPHESYSSMNTTFNQDVMNREESYERPPRAESFERPPREESFEQPPREESFERPPRVERSDSTSSSGPDDIFEDFFDSFTSDSMFFNLKRMNSLVKKHFGQHHPLFQKHGHFDHGFRKMGSRRRSSSHNRRSSKLDNDSQNEDTDNDFDVDSPFSAVGSQNIQRLLKNFNKDSVDDFLQNRFSTIGRHGRRASSRFSGRDSADSGRQSLFDSFVASDKRPGSAFERSVSHDRQKHPSSARSSYNNIRSQYHDSNSKSDYRKPDYSQQSSRYSNNPDYSRPNSQLSHETLPPTQKSEYLNRNFSNQSSSYSSVPDYNCQSTQFSNPDYSRQSSQFTAAPEYTRQSSQFSTEPEHNRHNPHTVGSNYSRQTSNASDFSRQNSQFSGIPVSTRQSYTFSTGPEFGQSQPHVISHRITRNTSTDSPTFSNFRGDDFIPRKSSIPTNVYSRQSSQSSNASETSRLSQMPDTGFKATIKLSRSGFEPPDIQHSVYGTMRPHIRIRYTRSESGGVPETTYSVHDGTQTKNPSSKCEDGIHCGTPEREVSDGKCTDGKHCGTPPPSCLEKETVSENGNSLQSMNDAKYNSPSIYATMKPWDIRKYIRSQSGEVGVDHKWTPQELSRDDGPCEFDARPDENKSEDSDSNKDSVKLNINEQSNHDPIDHSNGTHERGSCNLDIADKSRSKSRSPSDHSNCENEDAKSETSNTSTMSLLESLKTLGYADVMKSRQSQENLHSAQLIADARAKRLAGMEMPGAMSASNERLNMLSHCSYSRQNSQSSEANSFSKSDFSNSRSLLSPPKPIINSRAKSEEVTIPRMNDESRESNCSSSKQSGNHCSSRCGSEEPRKTSSYSESVCSETSDLPDSDATDNLKESVSERIRRKSYFTRFNDDRPRRSKKSVLTEKTTRRHSGLYNSFDDNFGGQSSPASDYPSSRRTSYSHSFSRESSYDQPEIGIRSSPSLERCMSSGSSNGSLDSSSKNVFRNHDEWFQEAEARASQMLDEMYEHDARMLQSLPLRHRSSRKSGFASDGEKKSRRPKHYDNFQPSSGYLSNLHKPNNKCQTEEEPKKSSQNSFCNGNDKFSSLMDDVDDPREVLRKAMDLLKC